MREVICADSATAWNPRGSMAASYCRRACCGSATRASASACAKSNASWNVVLAPRPRCVVMACAASPISVTREREVAPSGFPFTGTTASRWRGASNTYSSTAVSRISAASSSPRIAARASIACRQLSFQVMSYTRNPNGCSF